MKRNLKIALIVIAVLVVLYFVAGFIYMGITEHNRLKNLDLDGDIIVITETEYLGYMEEIYMYPEKYLGKEIVIEGFYDSLEYDDGEYINFVYRILETEDGHSHDEECEDEHSVGFEFFCDDELPEVGSFIQVKGTLGTITEGEEEFLVLEDCTVRTDIKEGAKTVK